MVCIGSKDIEKVCIRPKDIEKVQALVLLAYKICPELYLLRLYIFPNKGMKNGNNTSCIMV